MAEGDWQDTPAAGRVRVLSPRGTVHGAGILVAPGLVLSCAHVVAGALGARPGPAPPADPVLLDAAGFPDAPRGTATVVAGGWFPGPLDGAPGGDLAVLATDWRPPDAVRPAPLGRCDAPPGREVRMYGYPGRAPDGLWATARLAGSGGPHPHWVQLDGTGATAAWIAPGFSGAGVWDPAARRVVGMVTAAFNDRQTRAAWMLPLQEAARAWPDLAPALDGHNPPPARPAPAPEPPLPDDRAQFALADALLGIRHVEEDGGAALRQLLPAPLRHGIRSHPRPRLQLFHLVQACVDHREGRRALVDAVRLLDDGSRPARAALALLDELWPADPGGDAR
ncbi:trypsin-like peptidase domain-containing protein [Streptomyces longispororuber]|uniref:effector-associated domain 2-containing protein n=1 Tax=Streptomyces longispororuber TaxID=68230 RepID=UPI0036FCEFE1